MIAAEIIGNQVKANVIVIVAVLQGWINDSHIIIVEIQYFCFNHTKFNFNIFIKFFVITYEPSFVQPPMTNISVPDVIDP